jgi:hypothetical protein
MFAVNELTTVWPYEVVWAIFNCWSSTAGDAVGAMGNLKYIESKVRYEFDEAGIGGGVGIGTLFKNPDEHPTRADPAALARLIESM